MNQATKRYMIIWFIASIFLLMGFTNDIPFDKEDQKKLEKAQELNQEAQKLIDKANLLYSELAQYDVSDSKNDKKTEGLKNKALDYQLKAVELQKEANFIEYGVLKKVIPVLKSKFLVQNEIPSELELIEEQIEELFYKAEKLRNEAYKLEKSEKEERYTKLASAQEYEWLGIDKQNQLVDIYSGKARIESENQTKSNASQNDEKVVINEELLKAYLDYINQKDSFLSVSAFRNLLYSDSLSSSSMRNTWEDYLYDEKPELVAEESISTETTGEISKDIAIQSDDFKEITTKLDDQSEDVIDDIIYKVQIAADKIPLSQNTLRRIYNGHKEIKMISEEGWSKYSIGDFNTFSEAADYKKTINVNDAFVVAYKNGVKVDLFALRRERKKPTHKKNEIVSDLTTGIIFKVQIAADKRLLSSEKLHAIYSGYEKISRFEEDSWYKYSVGEFNNYNDANEFRKICGAKGAFVIAFKGNNKMNVLEAKKAQKCFDPVINKNWISENKVLIFKVQIAASPSELSVNQIKNICCIETNVYLTEENDWFKYSIGNFSSYQKALQLKKISGVNGAFIVAYKKGQKINIKEAIKLSKTKNN